MPTPQQTARNITTGIEELSKTQPAHVILYIKTQIVSVSLFQLMAASLSNNPNREALGDAIGKAFAKQSILIATGLNLTAEEAKFAHEWIDEAFYPTNEPNMTIQ